MRTTIRKVKVIRHLRRTHKGKVSIRKHARRLKNRGAVIQGKDLPVQLHIGSRKLREFEPIKNRKDKIYGYSEQGPRGGFWTSSYSDLTGKSDWLKDVILLRKDDYAKEKAMGFPYTKTTGLPMRNPELPHYRVGMLIKPKDNAHILELDKEKDYQHLFEKYGRLKITKAIPELKLPDRLIPTINWEKISKDYDAVHLSKGVFESDKLGEVHLDKVVEKKYPRIFTYVSKKYPKLVPEENKSPHGFDRFEYPAAAIHATESTLWFKPRFHNPLPIKIDYIKDKEGKHESKLRFV